MVLVSPTGASSPATADDNGDQALSEVASDDASDGQSLTSGNSVR